MTIDNGNHLLLSGNHAALAYLRSIGAARPARRARAAADFAFVDLASGERWTLRINDGRIPWWIFDPSRRVPGTGVLDYLAAGAAALGARTARPIGEVMRCDGPALRAAASSRCCSPRSTPIRREGSARLAGAVIRETLALGGTACRPLIARDGSGRGASSSRRCAFLASAAPGAVRSISCARLRLADGAVAALDFGDETDRARRRRRASSSRSRLTLRRRWCPASTAPTDSAPSSTRISASIRRPDAPPILGVVNGTARVAVRLSRPALGHHQRAATACSTRRAKQLARDDLGRGRDA